MSDPESPSAFALPPLRIDLRRPGFRRAQSFDLRPGPAERTALAAHLGLLDLPALRLAGEVAPAGRQDATLTARLTGRVVQACVVTLVPVETAIDEPVIRRYLAEMPEAEGEEVEIPEDDSLEELPPVLDVAAVAVEALALALPLYPRAPGAELGQIEAAPPGAEPLTEEKLRPFAGLAALKDRLTGGGSGQA